MPCVAPCQHAQIDVYEITLRAAAEQRAAFTPIHSEKRSAVAHRAAASAEEQIIDALSESELMEYQLRYSQLANRMRSQVLDFTYTEQEFRAIFSVHKSYDQQERPFGSVESLASAKHLALVDALGDER